MKLKLAQKKVNYLLFLILLFSIFFINGCVIQPAQGMQIVIKDLGIPELKYLQPTITEIQLQNEGGSWITIWSNSEGKTVKLTPDGAEMVLDTVSVPAGTYIGTKIKASTIDVEADINRDGDTLDKNVQIILTLEEFNSLPQRDRPQRSESAPSAPEQPSAPSAPEGPSAPEEPSAPAGEGAPGEQPSAPEEPSSPEITGEATEDSAPEEPSAPEGDGAPEEPSAPEKPSEPEQPSAPEEPSSPYNISNGFVYMPEFLDEVHTATPPYWDGIEAHYSTEGYIFPLLANKFVYDGSGGKIVYDFALHPLMPKDRQISVDVSITA